MPTKRFQDKTSSWFKNLLCPSNHSFGIVVDDKNEVERCRMAEGWFFDIPNYPVDCSKLLGCGIPSLFDSFTVYVDCIDLIMYLCPPIGLPSVSAQSIQYFRRWHHLTFFQA